MACELVEYWHNYLASNTNVDIFEIIDHAISIAARENPAEFKIQRGRILAKLCHGQRDQQSNDKVQEKIIDKVTKSIMEFDGIDVSLNRSNSYSETQHLNICNGVSKCLYEELTRLKYETIKRKVQEAYRQVANKRPKVKAVELHELPKQRLGGRSLHVIQRNFKRPPFSRW
ncbi:hypothetical protein FRX31_013534 [Thalictrum thalictroides]|uniref:Uncharacterized protein n=1 Tax=Thalictrum thalictroides TaxID=46969 RepID=A0A7J6WHP6_THATH|nr:hypothetical protein FRX31_013534 [Thalictrum thalictroides]